MKAFAVFTLHQPAEAAWIEAGCFYLAEDPRASSRVLLRGELAGDKLAVLRITCGAALGEKARAESSALGGVCIEVETEDGSFPSQSRCYDALRAELAKSSGDSA